jgi:hypothetical protein
MKRVHRYLAVALISAGVLWAGRSLAQSPFDGAWRIDPSKTVHDSKPISAYIAQGWYHCESCVPPYTAKADGSDQPVNLGVIDTISVKDVDARTVDVVGRKEGLNVFKASLKVSEDGKTLIMTGHNYPPNGQKSVDWKSTLKRIGTRPPGVHATSGQWQMVNDEVSDNALLVTYETDGAELTMTMLTGATYTAKFDGNEYPFKGSYRFDTVSLKRLGERSFEETDKVKGVLLEVDTWTVSPDGKTMTLVSTQTGGRKSTFVLTKAQEKK